jgi:hypothetical protein
VDESPFSVLLIKKHKMFIVNGLMKTVIDLLSQWIGSTVVRDKSYSTLFQMNVL